ncbi:MAG TPA: STAS domain-containing protein [Polyangia bacterium]|nr:STAS domain-containing protein [Polyangia bacterium]
MSVPILRHGNVLIASIQVAQTDDDLLKLRDRLSEMVGQNRAKGVVIDVTAFDVLDSFATRTLRDIAYGSRLRGARTVVVGIQPDVAFAMVQLGLDLGAVSTALDLDDAVAELSRPPSEVGRR